MLAGFFLAAFVNHILIGQTKLLIYAIASAARKKLAIEDTVAYIINHREFATNEFLKSKLHYCLPT